MEVEVLISRGKLLNELYEQTRNGKALTYTELVVIISRLQAENKQDWRLP